MIENNVENIIVEEIKEKPYKFRTLNSTDVFLMFKIIGKIGVNEFNACFKDGAFRDLVSSVSKNGENNVQDAATSLFLEVANVLFNNIPKCEGEIYKMLSNTSNLTYDEVMNLDAVTFFEMVIDFIKKEEFKDFIKVVSKLFK